MIDSKHTPRIIVALTALAVIVCLLAGTFSSALVESAGGEGVRMEYESALFDTSEIITIDIQMDEAQWADMLENAISETYYSCNVVVNGTTFYEVGIRPKGNTSLSSIVSDPDSDRYSFKLEFDRSIDGQTCFGLDKLVLNNNYADATNMKEAIVYDMFRYLGANASLYNYAKLSVNGEYWGVYLALEAVEDSFLLRNYGVSSGELYKPDSLNMGGGKDGMGGDMPNMGDFDPSQLENLDPTQFGNFDPSQLTNFDPAQMGFFGNQTSDGTDGDMPAAPEQNRTDAASDQGSTRMDFSAIFEEVRENFGDKGGFGMGGNGSDLNYVDDDPDSYSAIWEGEVSKTNDADHARVVAALKNVSEGVNLDSSLSIDSVLRYMAAHVFSVNDDSLSGSMAHNYYLYESNGRLSIIPWDYNLSWGGMSGGSASSVINDAIDSPFSITNFFDALLSDETYLGQYHEYLSTLVEEYVFGGTFDETYSRIRSQIDALVETDPTAFYSYDEYVAAAETLYETIRLRAESIRGQLDGTIPSTDDAQRTNSSALVDASSINLNTMGGMHTGGGFDRDDRAQFSKNGASDMTEGKMTASRNDANVPLSSGAEPPSDMPNMPGTNGMTPPSFDDESGMPSFPGGDAPDVQATQSSAQPPAESENPVQVPDDLPDVSANPSPASDDAAAPSQASDDAAPPEDGQSLDRQTEHTRRGQFTSSSETPGENTNFAILLGCLILAVAALIFVACFPRKRR